MAGTEAGTDRAVVIGASMAGLLTARVLSERYARVTVLDRDNLPVAAQPRRGVPQARHSHGLLAKGREILEELFPGLTAELLDQGAVSGDMQSDFRWYLDGRRLCPGRSGLRGLGVSRALLESCVRARVTATAGVDIIERSAVAELTVTADRCRVTGVRILPGSDGGFEEVVPADLVVDATGRGSRSPVWLEALGYPRPAEESVRINMVYVTRQYRREREHFGGADGASVGAVPPSLRSCGTAIAQEGGRWIVSLAGALGEEPPMDADGFAAFAAGLAAPDIAELVRTAQPLGEPVRARFPASLRRRYERLRAFPEGYLVIGDGICSVNPVYAQGMTVAAAQALLLRDCLRRGHARLAPRFFRRAARLIDVPWSLAVGADLRFPEVPGARSAQLRLTNRYVARLQAAAQHDPVVGRAFLEVANLLVRPERLLAPDIALRVLRGGRAVTAATALAAAPTTTATTAPAARDTGR